jgi:hypothetical protein
MVKQTEQPLALLGHFSGKGRTRLAAEQLFERGPRGGIDGQPSLCTATAFLLALGTHEVGGLLGMAAIAVKGAERSPPPAQSAVPMPVLQAGLGPRQLFFVFRVPFG